MPEWEAFYFCKFKKKWVLALCLENGQDLGVLLE